MIIARLAARTVGCATTTKLRVGPDSAGNPEFPVAAELAANPADPDLAIRAYELAVVSQCPMNRPPSHVTSVRGRRPRAVTRSRFVRDGARRHPVSGAAAARSVAQLRGRWTDVPRGPHRTARKERFAS